MFVLADFPSVLVAAGSVRWLTTSGVSLKPTEGEMKLAALLKEKLNPTYLAVEDVSCEDTLI